MASFGAVSVIQEPCCEITNFIPSTELPDRMRVPRDGSLMLQEFLATTMDMLVSEIPLARDTAKEALGSELNPRLFMRLFKQLNE